jgi:hypothetical protein
MIKDKNKTDNIQEKIYESDSGEETIKDLSYKLNRKTYIFFQLKAIVKKTSVIKEISSTLDKIANENFDDLMNILE